MPGESDANTAKDTSIDPDAIARAVAAHLSAGKPAPAEKAGETKVYTRKELDNLISDGRISEADAEAILEEQMASRVAARVETRKQTKDIAANANDEIRQYTDAMPKIKIAGSPERTRVTEEFNRLVEKLGMPNDVRTEAIALRNVFGPPESLRKPRRETPGQETDVGHGGGGEDETERAGTMPKGLTNDQRAYYRSAIDKGVYKDWDEVAKIEKYRKPRHRAA